MKLLDILLISILEKLVLERLKELLPVFLEK